MRVRATLDAMNHSDAGPFGKNGSFENSPVRNGPFTNGLLSITGGEAKPPILKNTLQVERAAVMFAIATRD